MEPEWDQKLTINDDFIVQNIQCLFGNNIDGPFLVGYDKYEDLIKFYNYDEEQFYTMNKEDSKFLYKEKKEQELTKILINLNFHFDKFFWYFFFIMPKKLCIFYLNDKKILSPLKKEMSNEYYVYIYTLKIIKLNTIIM